jgi:hypothetical protein
MKCPLCQHRGKFPPVGRQHSGGKVYRCPRCKLDQYRALGTGAYLVPGSYDLDVPAETSLYKLHYEKLMVDHGVMSREDMTTPASEEALDRIVKEHVADAAERAGFEELSQLMRDRPGSDA